MKPRYGDLMQRDELKSLFDQQAAGYDKQWEKTAPIREGLHFLLGAVFADLPVDARILCVGAGTGAELSYLADKFPQWRFTAVDPSGAMLAVCRRRAESEGFVSRCEFHEGYLESLGVGQIFDGATCFLVSQFILDESARSAFFRGIASRMRPGGILASSDLAAEASERELLLKAWFNVMSAGGISEDGLERMRAAYAKDVAVLEPRRIKEIIASGGFETPVQFFQSGMIHAWFSKRGARP